jgi:hypothetical protein
MRIVHILANGEKVESIQGHIVSTDNVEFYYAIKKIIEEDKSK